MCDSFTESRSLWTGASLSAHLMQAQLLSAGLNWSCSSAVTKKRALEGYPRKKIKRRVWKAEDSKTNEAASITTWGRAGVRKHLGRESVSCGGKKSPGRTRDDIKHNFRRISGYSLHLPSLRNAEHHLKADRDVLSGGGDCVWGRIQPSTDEVLPRNTPGTDETGHGDWCWRRTTR